MRIKDIKIGMVVVITSPIERELDGVKRVEGVVGVVDAPVSGNEGVWWWITHADGNQCRYRYCEISALQQ